MFCFNISVTYIFHPYFTELDYNLAKRKFIATAKQQCSRQLLLCYDTFPVIQSADAPQYSASPGF